MDLSTITCVPHALGYISIGCDDDVTLEAEQIRGGFLVTARHHHEVAPDSTRDAGESTSAPRRLALHPAHAALMSAESNAGEQRIKEIPIRMFFNKAENALSIKYQAYDPISHRPVCTGNGKLARRHMLAPEQPMALAEMTCLSPERCEFVQSGAAVCRRQVRMSVQIEGQGDPLSVFEVRTSSLNTYRALRAQLQLVEHRFGGLRHVPLRLVLWEVSTKASSFQAFTVMRLELAAVNELEAMKVAQQARAALVDAGINDDVDAAIDGGSAGSQDLSASSLEYYAVPDRSGRPLPDGASDPIAEAPETSTYRTTSPALTGAARVFIDRALGQAIPSAGRNLDTPEFF